MSTNIRQERMARLLFEELSIIVGSELEDPRLSLARVTDVKVSRDLRNVKVFVYHDDEEVSQRDVLNALRQAQPYVRREIATRCTMRAVPELMFAYDESPQRAARINDLLAQIAEERSNSTTDDAGANATNEGDQTSGDQPNDATNAGPEMER
jgi:ribosome-binding factor A